jgi:hypothetical protein
MLQAVKHKGLGGCTGWMPTATGTWAGRVQRGLQLHRGRTGAWGGAQGALLVGLLSCGCVACG